MPTGYTSILGSGKGVTFQEFTMRCARACGALADLREDPDATIPDEFNAISYYDAVKKAKRRLAEAKKWSNTLAERKATKVFDDEVRFSKEFGKENEEARRVYGAMLKQVRKWVPPTKDHEELKRFMIEQLAVSESDCFTPEMPQRLSGKQYRSQLIKNACRDIADYTKRYKEEVVRARKKSEWVRALRHSLNSIK